ncbi:MAG: CAP domain-containing protein [Terriglobia bacterium]
MSNGLRSWAIVRIGVAVMMVVSGSWLSAAPKNEGMLPEPRSKPLVQAALASAPGIARLSDAACGGDAACEGMRPLATQMLALVNADRLNPANDAETGGAEQPLKWDPRLAQAALVHSQEMALNHYFSHYGLNGKSPAERISKAGVRWRQMGENIARNYTVFSAEAAFMNEPRFQPNHRGNILNSKFNYVGMGIVRGPDGMVYATQEFAQEP